MYTVMREPAPAPAASPTAPPPQVARVQPPAPPTTPTTPPTTPPVPPPVEVPGLAAIDAGVEAPTGKRPTPTPKVSTTTSDTDAGDDGPADSIVGRKLREAQQLLDARDYQKAETAANAVITAEDVRPVQKARATLIHGTVQCVFRNNEDGAGSDLRLLIKFPAMHDQLIDRCQKAGYLDGRPRLRRR
jgi:hypothetical protein